MIYLLSFCLCFSLSVCLSASQPCSPAQVIPPARRQSAPPGAFRTPTREPRPTLPVFSFARARFCSQVGFVGDHHLDISDQSPGLRVRVELHGIASDVEVRPLDCCVLLRA